MILEIDNNLGSSTTQNQQVDIKIPNKGFSSTNQNDYSDLRQNDEDIDLDKSVQQLKLP